MKTSHSRGNASPESSLVYKVTQPSPGWQLQGLTQGTQCQSDTAGLWLAGSCLDLLCHAQQGSAPGQERRILWAGMMSQGDRGRTFTPGNKSWLPAAAGHCLQGWGTPPSSKGVSVPYHTHPITHLIRHHITHLITHLMTHHITAMTPGLCSFPA